MAERRRLVEVSIRYIAVLGFQPKHPDNINIAFFSFQSAISRYLVSNNMTEVKVTVNFNVSIRYIAVLGFQHCKRDKSYRFHQKGFNPLYRGTWFPTLGPTAPVASGSQFQSAISRYLGSDPTRKTPPLTSGGGNGLHTPVE